MRARLVLLCAFAVTLPMNPSGQALPRTRAEQTNFEETSRYAEVIAFANALATISPRVRVETFGTSEEGRTLPLLVIGDPPASEERRQGVPVDGGPQPADGRRRPVVFVMANIHAGEVEGKEAVLHLARRLAAGDLQSLLPGATWLFAPIYNADGNERISLDNRTEQHGPTGGVGTRENANGLDLNRDFIKLDTAEARALIALFTRWDPDVIIDLHTTNGSYHGYHLTYAPALNPNGDPAVIAFTRERLLAAVRQAMSARHGFRTYHYGNFATAESINEELNQFSADERRTRVWRTYDQRPRFGNNYIGLRNRIAVLSEAYSYLDFAGRVKATEAFVEEIMRFVAANGAEIRQVIARADNQAIAGEPREAAVAFELRRADAPSEILVGAVQTVANPRSGKPMKAMVEDAATPTRMADYTAFAPTTTRPVPREYVVPVSTGVADVIAGKLREHGVRFERLTAAVRMPVERFIVGNVRRAERPFQGHLETSVTGRVERADVDVPAGSLVVTTRQPLGRLVFYLLEPESDDGLGTWNVLDAALKPGAPHPVLKRY